MEPLQHMIRIVDVLRAQHTFVDASGPAPRTETDMLTGRPFDSGQQARQPCYGYYGCNAEEADLLAWTMFGLSVLATLFFSFLLGRSHKRARVFHLLLTISSFVSAMVYYGVATHVGITYVMVSRMHVTANGRGLVIDPREVSWMHYVHLATISPILVVSLCMMASVPALETTLAVVADVGAALLLTIGALTYTSCPDEEKVKRGACLALDVHGHRWGYFAFSCLLFMYVAYTLLSAGRKAAFDRSKRLGYIYIGLAVDFILLSAAYVLTNALGTYQNLVGSRHQEIGYAIIDALVVAGLGLVQIALEFGLKSYWEEVLHLESPKASSGFVRLPTEEIDGR